MRLANAATDLLRTRDPSQARAAIAKSLLGVQVSQLAIALARVIRIRPRGEAIKDMQTRNVGLYERDGQRLGGLRGTHGARGRCIRLASKMRLTGMDQTQRLDHVFAARAQE